MRLKRFFWIAPTTLLLIASQTFRLNFPVSFAASPVVAQTSDAREAEADRLLEQGIKQYRTSQLEAALQSFQKALTTYQKIGDRRSEGVILNNIGAVYRSLRNYSRALEFYQQALTIHREVGNRAGEGILLSNIGVLYENLDSQQPIDECLRKSQQPVAQCYGDFRALKYYQQALALAREVGERNRENVILVAIGDLIRGGLLNQDINNFKELEAYLQDVYQQISAIQKEFVNRPMKMANSTGLLTVDDLLDKLVKTESYENVKQLSSQEVTRAYIRRGDFLFTLGTLHQFLLTVRNAGDRAGEGAVLNDIGTAYYYLGQYRQALEYDKWSLVIQREISNRDGESTNLNTIGLAYENLGQYSQALEAYQQALAIDREIGDRSGEGVVLNNIGKLYERLGQYSQALETYQQALLIHREVHNGWMEAITLSNIGLVYDYLGQHLQALEVYRQLSPPHRQTNTIARISHNAGLAYSHLGNYQEALERYKSALSTLRELSDFKQEAIDPHLEGDILNSMCLAYKELGQYHQALEICQEALELFRKMNVRVGEGLTLNNLGNIYKSLGQYAEAETNLFKAVEVWESLRASELNDANKISLFETQATTYRLLQQALIAQNKIDEALSISERGRARAFVELLNQRLSPDPKKTSKIPSPDINQIKQIAKLTNATLVQYSIIYDDLKGQVKQQIKESELYIWVIKPTGEVIFRKTRLQLLQQQQNTSLKNLVTTTRNSIGVDDRSIFIAKVQHPVNEEEQTKSLQQLHQLLIAPIADLLPTDPNQRVIFIPQDELFLVPFAALQDDKGKYLIEKHTILTAPSIQVLELTRQQREKVKQAAAKDALVLGNPTMPSVPPKIGEKPRQLASLPGAKREAEMIAPLLNTKALTGNQATKAAVLARLSQARIVHLATHGLIDDFQGLQSAVALAPTNSDNGLLTAEEILNLKLNADLVVLSACNTGRGRITGDGVIGLSRSLFIAGTPSVIVSLWSVPDAPTAELMTEFYTNFYQKKLDKAQALRQAMLKIMEKHRDNPRAWAAFTLIGEAE